MAIGYSETRNKWIQGAMAAVKVLAQEPAQFQEMTHKHTCSYTWDQKLKNMLKENMLKENMLVTLKKPGYRIITFHKIICILTNSMVYETWRFSGTYSGALE